MGKTLENRKSDFFSNGYYKTLDTKYKQCNIYLGRNLHLVTDYNPLIVCVSHCLSRRSTL